MPLIEFDTIDSTNAYALKNFSSLATGTVISAKCQTAGRGRLGRKWLSPENCNIYASLVLRDVSRPGFLTGLGVLSFLREAAPEIGFYLKWPNDIYTANGKIAGILCEGASFSGGVITGAVAGIGININMTAEELSAVGQAATSLFCECGRKFNLIFLLSLLEKSLDMSYIKYSKAPRELFNDWRRENYLIGREVEVEVFGEEMRHGIFADVTPDGALILEESTGQRSVFSCADVKLRGNFMPQA